MRRGETTTALAIPGEDYRETALNLLRHKDGLEPMAAQLIFGDAINDLGKEGADINFRGIQHALLVRCFEALTDFVNQGQLKENEKLVRDYIESIGNAVLNGLAVAKQYQEGRLKWAKENRSWWNHSEKSKTEESIEEDIKYIEKVAKDVSEARDRLEKAVKKAICEEQRFELMVSLQLQTERIVNQVNETRKKLAELQRKSPTLEGDEKRTKDQINGKAEEQIALFAENLKTLRSDTEAENKMKVSDVERLKEILSEILRKIDQILRKIDDGKELDKDYEEYSQKLRINLASISIPELTEQSTIKSLSTAGVQGLKIALDASSKAIADFLEKKRGKEEYDDELNALILELVNKLRNAKISVEELNNTQDRQGIYDLLIVMKTGVERAIKSGKSALEEVGRKNTYNRAALDFEEKQAEVSATIETLKVLVEYLETNDQLAQSANRITNTEIDLEAIHSGEFSTSKAKLITLEELARQYSSRLESDKARYQRERLAEILKDPTPIVPVKS